MTRRTSRCAVTAWPSRLKVSSEASASRASAPSTTAACPAWCSSSRRTPAADSTAIISITPAQVPPESPARTASSDSSTASATPCG